MGGELPAIGAVGVPRPSRQAFPAVCGYKGPKIDGGGTWPDTGFALVAVDAVDFADLNIRLRVGWNDCTNQLFFITQVFDDLHHTDREDPLAYWQADVWEVVVNLDHTAPEAPPSLCISITVGTAPHIFFFPTADLASAHSPIGEDGVIG